MFLFFWKLSPDKGTVSLLIDETTYHQSQVVESILSTSKVLHNTLSLDFAEDLCLSSPLIRFTLNSIGSLVVKALIITLEYAPMPKTGKGFKSWSQIFLVLHFVLLLHFCFKLLKQLGRDNKQSLFIIKRLLFLIHCIGHTHIFWLRPQIGQNFQRARSYVLINSIDNSLNGFLLF